MVNKIKKIMTPFGEYPSVKIFLQNHTEFKLLKVRYLLRSASKKNANWFYLPKQSDDEREKLIKN